MSAKTREQLLAIAFDEVYYHGYHSVSVDNILKQAGISKGSMYNLFPSKKALMLAVIDEKLMAFIEEKYGAVLLKQQAMIDALLAVIGDRNNYDLNCGCRLNNLVQELSYQDEDFRLALEKVYHRFEGIIETALQRGVELGEIKPIDTKSLAIYIVAVIEGSIATAKKSQQPTLYFRSIEHLADYLQSFKRKD